MHSGVYDHNRQDGGGCPPHQAVGPGTNDPTNDNVSPADQPLRDSLKQLKWHLGLGAFLLFSWPIALLPRQVAVWLGGTAGNLAYLLLRKERTTVVENIRSSLPYLETVPGWTPDHGTPEAIARRNFANYGRTIVEALKLYYGLGKPFMNELELRGIEHFERAREQGKGTFFITGHCGNWELMALTFGVRYNEVAVVARRQKYDPLTNFLERLRHRFGNHVIYADGAARSIFLKLRKNDTIGILIDQAVQPDEGAIVDFLGRGAWTTTMPVKIAGKTGTPLLPIFIHREGGRHVVTIHPAVELPPHNPIAGTRLLNRAIEEYIARHPDEWLWVYRRWKRVPETD
ncbi:lipid A biosynthesis acyltransferase [Geotalea uraniireducens]|uniref:Lipid A biosynthesis acyltransferase n=1 Tax=Geotalea uraniireducens TaxID=351604 RepID=A0ABN6VYY3_9BACT|nr:lysophospholipid acyltransferase family protein [Geotalea uraniireducens]BDV44869.1 lipid A biosynthesis acyltransferase [Geotalea uraniireducens]